MLVMRRPAEGILLDLITGPLKGLRDTVAELARTIWWEGFATGFGWGFAAALALIFFTVLTRK